MFKAIICKFWMLFLTLKLNYSTKDAGRVKHNFSYCYYYFCFTIVIIIITKEKFKSAINNTV